MHTYKIVIGIVIFLIILGIVCILERLDFTASEPTKYGVSFNADHARYLGLNADEVYRAIVEEWGFKYVRLSAQWNNLEAQPGVYDFSELDRLMAISQKYDVKVILAVGQKTPRWPECHMPAWANNISKTAYSEALQKYITNVVERYKHHPALELWQVENEPLLNFGKCPNFSLADLKDELALVKQFDPEHGTLVTDSGEINMWQTTARIGDYFGTTLYKIVWNKYLGYLNYDWFPSSFYRFRLWLADRSPADAFVIELQAEPWLPDKSFNEVSIEEKNKSMNIDRLEKNVIFANRLGFARIYFWGAEWWYAEEKAGRGAFAAYIKNLPK